MSVVRNNQDNDFNNNNLTNINSITLNKQAENDKEVITKAYVDQFHQENERSRRDLGINFYDEPSDLVKNNQENDLNDNKLTNLDSKSGIRNPTSKNELVNKKNLDDELDKNTIFRLIQTLENYLKVSVGIETYNLTKYKKEQITDTTNIKNGNAGGYFLPSWRTNCYDKNKNGKIQKFKRSTKTNSPSSDSGAESLPPIGNAFMYIETSSNNHGNNAFISFKRNDVIQINNITFYYNRFSILTDDHLKSMGRFRIQLKLEDNTWSTRYKIPKNDRYSDTSTDCTLVNLIFTIEIFGFKFICDEIDTPHADMCFSNITITHSVF